MSAPAASHMRAASATVAGIRAEHLHGQRVLVACDAQVAERALVAVREPARRDHLGAHEARAEAPALAAEGLHGDAGHRREHDARARSPPRRCGTARRARCGGWGEGSTARCNPVYAAVWRRRDACVSCALMRFFRRPPGRRALWRHRGARRPAHSRGLREVARGACDAVDRQAPRGRRPHSRRTRVRRHQRELRVRRREERADAAREADREARGAPALRAHHRSERRGRRRRQRRACRSRSRTSTASAMRRTASSARPRPIRPRGASRTSRRSGAH